MESGHVKDHNWNSSNAQRSGGSGWGGGGSHMKALVNHAKEFGAYPESCGEALQALI